MDDNLQWQIFRHECDHLERCVPHTLQMRLLAEFKPVEYLLLISDEWILLISANYQSGNNIPS